MKKIIRAAAAVAAVTAGFVLFGGDAAKENDAPDHLLIIEIDRAVSNGDYSANEENINEELFYSNVKTQDIYRLKAFLTYLENDPGSANAENAKHRVCSALRGGATSTSDDYFALISSVYSELFPHISEAQHLRSGTLPDDPVSERVVCPALSGKYTVSADGTVWRYSDNYLISYEDGKLCRIVRSPVGMRKTDSFPDLTRLLCAKELFESDKNLKFSVRYETENETAALCESGLRDYGEVFCILRCGLSSPVYFDFTSFHKNPPGNIENLR